MKLLILLFALIGATYALVPGMEYQYDYEGQVKIGLPEIRKRVSGTGIKCQIKVQVQDDENVAIQLQDVQVGEYKGDVGCELRNRLPIQYKPVDGHAKLLEDVYVIRPSRSKGDVMESTKSEETWVTNIKKSIANLFIVEPLRNNFGGDENSPNMMNVRSDGHSVVDDEPSLFGQCSGDYSMVPLNNTNSPQSRSSHHHSAYPEQWTNYEMSRTINFDRCNISVNTKQASMGNGSESHVTQFGDVQSRHSVTRHNLTYDGQYFILQNGTVEGHFSVNPFGMNHEKLVSSTNQTYHLKSVSQMKSKWSLPTSTRIIDTWFMEAISPFSPADDSPDWIQYLSQKDAKYLPLVEEQYWTGIDLSQHYDEHKKNLDRALDNVADIAQREQKPNKEHDINPFDSDSAIVASELETSLRAARALDQDSLKSLFDQYYKDPAIKSQIKLRLLVDVWGASGTGASIKSFLDKLSEQKISVNRAASVFFSMPNNLISTPLIKEISEYVKSLDLDRDPYATSVIWTNFAATINKVSVNIKRSHHVVPYQIFGKEHTFDKAAVDCFLPFLEQKLKVADADWKRIVIIHSIGNIGSSRSFSLLKSIVEDERVTSTVRVSAVYAINRKKLDESFQRYALRSFMSIAENRTDDEYVRQACILSILSWKPPRSWYQTLASTSWMENSDEMSSFTYFILKSYAESSDPAISKQAQVARFFLPLTKPYAPTSRYSYSRLLSIYDSKHDLVTDFDVSSLRAGRYSDSIPRQVLALLVNSFGGYRFSVAQSSFSYDGRDVHSLLHKMSKLVSDSWSHVVRSAPNRKTQLAIRDVQDRMITKDSSSDSLATYYFSMFDDMEVLLPLDKDVVSKAFGRDGSRLLKEIDYSSANYTKFINPGLLSLVVPTEVGLPLISRFTLPTYTGGPIKDISLTADGQKCNSVSQLVRAKDIRLDVNANYRFASKAITMIRVLMPWQERVAASAVEALKGINLPGKFSLRIKRDDPKNKNISVSIIPTSTDQFTVAEVHTVPFVITKRMFALDKPEDLKNQLQVVSAKGTGEGVENVHTPINVSYTGITGKLRYEGDYSYPFTQGNAITLLRQPNLIPALFSSPTCRMLEASLTVDMSQSKTKEVHSSTSIRMDTSTAMSPKGDLPQFECQSTLLFNGSETRYFEVNVKNSEVSQSGSRHSVNLTINYKRSQLPHFDSNPAGYCLSLKRDGPKIKNFDDLRKALQSSQNSEVDFNGDLRGGSGAKACDEKIIASVSGSLKITDQRRTNLSQEIDSVCSYDPNDPTVTFTTAPVYDRLNVDIKYTEPVPRPLKNATYFVYDIIRGVTFPHSYFNYMDQQNNPQGKISIRGDRYLSEKRWKLEAKMPTETAKLDSWKMPVAIEDIVPVGGIDPSQQKFDSSKVLVSSHIDNHCVIRKNKVRVFDGYSYDYSADKCLASAVRDRRNPSSPVVLTGVESNTLIAKILFPKTGTTVVVKPSSMTVDDKEVRLENDKPTDVKSSDGTVLARASKTDSYIQIDIPELARIRVRSSQEISVLPSESMRAHYAGLCGNYDGSKRELIGPQLCKYSDSRLFAKAWTEKQGKECDQDHYDKIRREVQEFQRNCPKKRDNVVRKSSVLAEFGKVPADCIEYVYKIKRNGQALCVSQNIVAICYPLCKLDKPRFYEEVYDCWPEQYAPKELERNEKRGYIRHKIDRQAYVTTAFKTEHAFMCSRK